MMQTKTRILRKIESSIRVKKTPEPTTTLRTMIERKGLSSNNSGSISNLGKHKSSTSSSLLSMSFLPTTETDTPSRHICCRCKHQRGAHIVPSTTITNQTTATKMS